MSAPPIYHALRKKEKDMDTTALATYRRTALLRQQAAVRRHRERLERARRLVRRAAALLRERFQAQRVVVFGSLLRPEHFGERSDVDLAAWGLAERDFLRAVAAVTSLDDEISVDLIEGEQAPPNLRQHIEEEGLEI